MIDLFRRLAHGLAELLADDRLASGFDGLLHFRFHRQLFIEQGFGLGHQFVQRPSQTKLVRSQSSFAGFDIKRVAVAGLSNFQLADLAFEFLLTVEDLRQLSTNLASRFALGQLFGQSLKFLLGLLNAAYHLTCAFGNFSGHRRVVRTGRTSLRGRLLAGTGRVCKRTGCGRRDMLAKSHQLLRRI